jgi:hypothetical protein
MASIAHNIKERSTNNYITTGSFNGQFFNYTTSFNTTTLTTTGTLAEVTGATVTNCPQGRVLRATGKKLYPGGAYPGVSTMLIGVYDSLSLLSGFIDPNSSVFALYNHDKPVDVIDAFDLSGNVIHKGPPVFTLGDVIAGRQIRSNTITTSTATTGTVTIDPSLGQVFRFSATMTGAVTLAAKAGAAAALPGAVVYVIFSDGGGRTFIGDQSTVLTAALVNPMTNAKGFAVTLVSNGTAFVQTSAVQLNVLA